MLVPKKGKKETGLFIDMNLRKQNDPIKSHHINEGR